MRGRGAQPRSQSGHSRSWQGKSPLQERASGTPGNRPRFGYCSGGSGPLPEWCKPSRAFAPGGARAGRTQLGAQALRQHGACECDASKNEPKTSKCATNNPRATCQRGQEEPHRLITGSSICPVSLEYLKQSCMQNFMRATFEEARGASRDCTPDGNCRTLLSTRRTLSVAGGHIQRSDSGTRENKPVRAAQRGTTSSLTLDSTAPSRRGGGGGGGGGGAAGDGGWFPVQTFLHRLLLAEEPKRD